MVTALIMPVYRHADWLPLSIPAALVALGESRHLVVVTDGDPESEVVAKSLIKGRSNAHLLATPQNHGTGHALNVGHGFAIENLGAKKLGWISADNFIFDNYCDVLEGVLSDDSPFVYANYKRVDGRVVDGKFVLDRTWTAAGASPYDSSRFISHHNNGWIGPAFLYTSGVWRMAGEHGGGVLHDYDWWMRAEEVTNYNFTFVNKVICQYNCHANRSSHRLADSRNKQAEEIREGARDRRGILK